MTVSWPGRRLLRVAVVAFLLASTLVAQPAAAAGGYIKLEPLDDVTVGWTGSPGKTVSIDYYRQGGTGAFIAFHNMALLKQWADVTIQGATSCAYLNSIDIMQCFLPENSDGHHKLWLQIVPVAPRLNYVGFIEAYGMMPGGNSSGLVDAVVRFKEGPDLEVINEGPITPVPTSPGADLQVPLELRNADAHAIERFALDVELTRGLTWKQPPANCTPTTSQQLDLTTMTCVYDQPVASGAAYQLPGGFDLLVEPYAFGNLTLRATVHGLDASGEHHQDVSLSDNILTAVFNADNVRDVAASGVTTVAPPGWFSVVDIGIRNMGPAAVHSVDGAATGPQFFHVKVPEWAVVVAADPLCFTAPSDFSDGGYGAAFGDDYRCFIPPNYLYPGGTFTLRFGLVVISSTGADGYVSLDVPAIAPYSASWYRDANGGNNIAPITRKLNARELPTSGGIGKPLPPRVR